MRAIMRAARRGASGQASGHASNHASNHANIHADINARRQRLRGDKHCCPGQCAGCPPCAPSPLCDGGGTRGEGRRSSPPHCSHPIHASMRTSTRSGKRCAVHCCGRHTSHGDKHMELQACASGKGRSGGPRRLRSFETCPLLCTDTLPCPSPPRMLSRFGDCMMRRCCGGGRRWRARRGRWWRWERGERRRGGGSAAARGDCWRAAWRRAAGQRPPWVSTVKGPPRSGVAEFFLLSALSER